MRHFSPVLLRQVGRLLLPVPTPRGIFMAFRLLLGACAIILPIIRAEGVRAVFFPSLVRGPRTTAART